MNQLNELALKVLVATIDAQWEGMGDVGSARYSVSCMTILFLNLQITWSDIKWVVSLVIVCGHFYLPQGFVWVCMG